MKRHKDCYVFANGNSPLRGGSETTTTGKAQCTSVADRFTFIHVGFDLAFERRTFDTNPEWTLRVQTIRHHAAKQNLDNIFTVTPRAMIKGGHLINAGIAQAMVEDMLIIKGADETSVGRLYDAAGKPANVAGKVSHFEELN